MNIFKSSRFDCLNEPSQKKKSSNNNSNSNNNNNSNNINNSNNKEEGNSFKSDYVRKYDNRDNRENRENKEKREKREEYEKQKRMKEKEEENMKNLAKENFPEFISTSEKDVIVIVQKPKENIISYIEKASKVTIKENKVDEIQPGWVEIKLDPTNNRKLIYNYGKTINTNETPLISNKKITGEYEVLEALVNLNNKRTQEYIDTWGYETWEKLYKCPNYEYGYFDMLDEEYEEQLEKEYQEELFYEDEIY